MRSYSVQLQATAAEVNVERCHGRSLVTRFIMAGRNSRVNHLVGESVQVLGSVCLGSDLFYVVTH